MDFQSSLFEAPATRLRGFDDLERRPLTRGAWVDVLRTWLPAADDVFTALVSVVPWRAERRQMYDRIVDVPRLVHTYMIDEPLPHPVLEEARDALSEHYLPELGEPFRTAGCCYYRDGRDSVAWHGDRIGRGNTHDTMVAIISLGDPRKLCLRPRREAAAGGEPTATGENAAELQGRHPDRPRGGGESIAIEMGHGDLLVMGGSCQRTWEHAVPKVASAGPRVSVQFRPFNVF
jgi:alkylated DNA repair dioxygenase AlkB